MAIQSNLNEPNAYRAVLNKLREKLAGSAPTPAATAASVPPTPVDPPAASPAPSATYQPDSYARSVPGGTYTVRQGDSLSKIAQRLLGDASRWREIYELNRQSIQNPNLIYPGQVFVLPGGAAKAAIAPPATRSAAPAQPVSAPAGATPPVLDLFHQLIQAYTKGQMGPVSSKELAAIGFSDKDAFFAALRPGAEEAERVYGVPAAVTLAQAALESGWGKSALGGYNIFGIKGRGPAGTTGKMTSEYVNGQYIKIKANFALYDSFSQAITEHGKLFHNGHYNKAMEQYKRDRDPWEFARNIQGIYATSPTYARDLISIIDKYHLA